MCKCFYFYLGHYTIEVKGGWCYTFDEIYSRGVLNIMITESVCSVQLRQWAAIVVDITFTSRKRRSCMETEDIVRRKCEEKRPSFSVLSVFVVIFVADTFSTQNYSLNTSLQIQTSIGKKSEFLWH